jgi:hypothetical protein
MAHCVLRSAIKIILSLCSTGTKGGPETAGDRGYCGLPEALEAQWLQNEHERDREREHEHKLTESLVLCIPFLCFIHNSTFCMLHVHIFDHFKSVHVTVTMKKESSVVFFRIFIYRR